MWGFQFGVTWLQNDKILSYNASSKTRVYQIHEKQPESVVKNMQYLDLFSCHYRSLCEICVFPTALVATAFLQKCTAKSKAEVSKGHGHKMAGKKHRARTRVKKNSIEHIRGRQTSKQQQEKQSMDQDYMKHTLIWQY